LQIVHERLLTDSASSTKAPEADIREDWDEFANDHNGRSTADQQPIAEGC
jgi:hypothetical protein